MKLSVTSYSFSQLFKKGGFTDADCIRLAKKMGFDAVEFAGLHTDEEDIIEYAKTLAEVAKNENIKINQYSIAADFLNSEHGFDGEIQRLKGEVDVAAALGCTGMRHDATWGIKGENKGIEGFNNVLPQLIEGCKRVSEYAKTKGIKTMVENHGLFCQDSERMELLVSGVAYENFGLLIDIGNFLCADEEPTKAVGRLKDFAAHLHVKDFHFKSGSGVNPGEGFFKTRAGNYLRGSIVGHGVVPVMQCMSIMKDSGYDDYVTIEFEGMEDAEKAVEIGKANLVNIIAQL